MSKILRVSLFRKSLFKISNLIFTIKIDDIIRTDFLAIFYEFKRDSNLYSLVIRLQNEKLNNLKMVLFGYFLE